MLIGLTCGGGYVELPTSSCQSFWAGDGTERHMVAHNPEHLANLGNTNVGKMRNGSCCHHWPVDESIKFGRVAGGSCVDLDQVRSTVRVEKNIVAKEPVGVVAGLNLLDNRIFFPTQVSLLLCPAGR